MQNKSNDSGCGCMIVIIIIFLILYAKDSRDRLYIRGKSDGYKQGQIDAANGIMKYVKVINMDKITTWELNDKKQVLIDEIETP